MIDQILLKNAMDTLADRAMSIVTLGEILRTDFGPEIWTVENLVPEGSITAICGAPASFKTWITLEIAKSVSKGTMFLGKFMVTKGNVLIIDKENNIKFIQKRFLMLGAEEDLSIHYLKKSEYFFIDDSKCLANLIDVIKEHKIGLVIFDSLVRIHSGDENDARQIAKVMGALKVIANKNTSVIFVHHNRKESAGTTSTANSMRGSSDILAGIDSLLQVNKKSKECLYVAQAKSRHAEETESFKVDIVSTKSSMELTYAGEGSFRSKDVTAVMECILDLLEECDKKYRQEILKEFKGVYTSQIIDSSLKELVATNQIIKEKDPLKYRDFYSLNKEL